MIQDGNCPRCNSNQLTLLRTVDKTMAVISDETWGCRSCGHLWIQKTGDEEDIE